MTTHRSRNKLERKAHMNMHDILEVPDSETLPREINHTRDRFGKRHKVGESEASS